MDHHVEPAAIEAQSARPTQALPSRQLAEARQALERAAAAGEPEAQVTLATLLFNGEGYPAEPARALRLLVEAAETGYTPALVRLAEVKSKDPSALEEAAALWTEAARRGSPAAMVGIARALTAGLGAPKDLGAARSRLEEAARLWYAPGMHEYGVVLTEGRGGPTDPVEGFAWIYASFCYSPNSIAADNLLTLADSLSPVDLRRARKRGVALARLQARERRHG